MSQVMRVRVNQNGGIKRYLDQAAAGLFIRGIACGQILHGREGCFDKRICKYTIPKH